MKYYSTNKNCPARSFQEAVVSGLAPDRGLYMPERIPKLSSLAAEALHKADALELCLQIASAFIEDEIDQDSLRRIVSETLDFPIPLVPVDQSISTLELFHGPTLAFKDVGARFMARVLSHFERQSQKRLTVLVATSGDTGSAVASGFLGVSGIQVVILYPSGKVSELQEKQLTTSGQNIAAFEVMGTFDDCQDLVKQAFLDQSLSESLRLTSANSINIARLLPQSFYYVLGVQQFLSKHKHPPVICVPSGNFGNLTAGLLAMQMGLPVKRFVAATNANDVVPEYLHTAIFKPRASIQTISNAMDVGNPSNLTRIRELFHDDIELMRSTVQGQSFSDQQTKEAISEIALRTGYILDPHGAVAYLGLKHSLKDNESGFFLETAHPAKFAEVVAPLLNIPLEIPERLASCLQKEKRAQKLEPVYEQLRDALTAL